MDKELRKEFQEQQAQVTLLRKKLQQSNIAKEEVYAKLKVIQDKIKQQMGIVISIKKERDALTKEVRELKKKRDILNKGVKEKSAAKQGADEKKKEFLSKFDAKENPQAINTQIKKLEEKIETEVMSFSKEKELGKVIKELKAKYKSMKEMSDVWKEISEVSADFSEKRKKAHESHREVQKKAQESQEKHEQLNAVYEHVRKCREEEKPLFSEYKKLRSAYEIIRKELSEALKKYNSLSKKLKEKQEIENKADVKLRTAAVKEKIKKGKKLSTEDILAFQAIKDS